MAQVAAGDAGACDRLVRRHLGRIVGFATRLLGDRAAAEDVAQETFLRLWQHARRWSPEARLTTWLHRVALNLCLDRRARRREAPLDDVPDPPDPAPPMTDVLQQQAVARHVQAAMQTLPRSQRAAIVLCHYQGFRNRDAAEVMGVSVEALESLLARGRRALRERLRERLTDLLGDG